MKIKRIFFFMILTLLFIGGYGHPEKNHYFRNSLTLNYEKSNKDYKYTFSVNPTMSKYFKNLNKCIGKNLNGSCGYVALGMLLSYYDTFYNDDTIAEQYDYQITPSSMEELVNESPGVRTEPDGFGGDLNKRTEYIREHSNEYFQSYLISLCMDNEEINYYNMYKKVTGINDINMLLALDRGCVQNILQFYIKSRSLDRYYHVIGKTLDKDSRDNSEVIKFIKEQLDSGLPVIVGTEKKDIAHMQVVHSYCYNSRNNKYYFYANVGVDNSNGSNCYVDPDFIVDACTLYPPFNALGSDNYGYFTINSNYDFNLSSNEIKMLSNSKNLWHNYFRFYDEIDANTLIWDPTNFGSINIKSISCFMIKPQYIYVATNESYDTSFIGDNVREYNCYMYVSEDINGNEEDDYYDPNAWASFSVTDTISFILNKVLNWVIFTDI